MRGARDGEGVRLRETSVNDQVYMLIPSIFRLLIYIFAYYYSISFSSLCTFKFTAMILMFWNTADESDESR